MRCWLWLFVSLAIIGTPTLVFAQEESPDVDDPPAESSSVAEARVAFVDGAELASKMLWGEALARFEASARLKSHAGTTYNIGICHRALGQYTRAQAVLERALEEDTAADGTELAESTRKNITGFLAEIGQVLATVEVTLTPASAALVVDGRPLELRESLPKKRPLLVAGTLSPGPGTAPPASKFTILLDPGAHVFMITRRGFSDAVVTHQVKPGSKTKLTLELERLPATLHVAASEADAAVSVDGIDVGVVPVTLLRPSGDYEVWVRKQGFDAYRTDVSLRAAERVDLMAPLQPTQIGLHERWWFWAALGTAVASTVVVTYFVTQPDPERPALDGGGLGWTIRVP